MTHDQPPHRSQKADHSDIRDVLPAFIARLPQNVAQLHALLQKGDAAGLQLLAHQLRGAGASYGFEPITRYAAEIENLLLARHPISQTAGTVDALASYMRNIEGYKS